MLVGRAWPSPSKNCSSIKKRWMRPLECRRSSSAIHSGVTRGLREQLGSSSERVASLISEGFEQSTDRHFAQYCYRSKGSSREIRTQLVVAVNRNHITESERIPISNIYEEIAKMLTGLIRHLETEDRKRRG